MVIEQDLKKIEMKKKLSFAYKNTLTSLHAETTLTGCTKTIKLLNHKKKHYFQLKNVNGLRRNVKLYMS